MAVVFLGLGSNVNPEENLRLAAHELRQRFSVRKFSRVYRSAALGFDGADFLNAVAIVESELSPQDVCRELDDIHALAGRERHRRDIVSRTLDIDLLLYDRLVLEKPRVPRSDVLDYSFVLGPLAETAPDFVHPVTGRSILEHWQAFDAASQPLRTVDLIL